MTSGLSGLDTVATFTIGRASIMRGWIAFAALTGFIAVGLGAMAAHGLKSQLSPERLAWLETGTRYALWHALALLLVAVSTRLAGESAGVALQISAWGFGVGIVLFSGGLYVMALADLRAFGVIVPFGGAGFLVGWGALFFEAMRAMWR